MNRGPHFVLGLLGLCTAAGSFAADEEKPLDWHALITVAQTRPTTDLRWGAEKAQILEHHHQFREMLSVPPRSQGAFLTEDVADGACSFVVQASFDHSAALSRLTLELPLTAPPECGKKWLAALQALYGKPLRSGPVQDIVVDADTPIQTAWRTPTSCITSMYTVAGAPHPAPFTVMFGDERAGACGYDDEAAFANRRKH